MLVALAISHLLKPAALTLLDYHYLCLWLVRNILINNKNHINLYFRLVETGVRGERKLVFVTIVKNVVTNWSPVSNSQLAKTNQG